MKIIANKDIFNQLTNIMTTRDPELIKYRLVSKQSAPKNWITTSVAALYVPDNVSGVQLAEALTLEHKIDDHKVYDLTIIDLDTREFKQKFNKKRTENAKQVYWEHAPRIIGHGSLLHVKEKNADGTWYYEFREVQQQGQHLIEPLTPEDYLVNLYSVDTYVAYGLGFLNEKGTQAMRKQVNQRASSYRSTRTADHKMYTGPILYLLSEMNQLIKEAAANQDQLNSQWRPARSRKLRA